MVYFYYTCILQLRKDEIPSTPYHRFPNLPTKDEVVPKTEERVARVLGIKRFTVEAS